MEALKYLARVGEVRVGKLLLWDGLQSEARVVKGPARPGLSGVRAASGGMNVEQA